MARTLSLELQEDVYEILVGMAKKAGRSLEALVSERLASIAGRRTADDDEVDRLAQLETRGLLVRPKTESRRRFRGPLVASRGNAASKMVIEDRR